MQSMRKSVLVLTVALLLPSAAPAQDLRAGFDLYETFTLSTLDVQVPADFFYPGSDPYFQARDFDGVPLVSSPLCPSVDLGNTDTIIERLSDASFPALPSTDTVPIEIVAMQLTSVIPITVTGTQPNEHWDIDVDLSPTVPSVGSMVITKIDGIVGTFGADIRVVPRLTFTRQSDSATRVWDFGIEGLVHNVNTPDYTLWSVVTDDLLCIDCGSDFVAQSDGTNLAPWGAFSAEATYVWMSVCEQLVLPVEETTWGAVKSLYTE